MKLTMKRGFKVPNDNVWPRMILSDEIWLSNSFISHKFQKIMFLPKNVKPWFLYEISLMKSSKSSLLCNMWANFFALKTITKILSQNW